MSGDLGDVASDAASQLAKAAYEDVAQPAARRIGVALSAVVKVALTPVSLMDWGYEQSKEWLAAKVDERLAKIPEERIVAPKLAIAVPVGACPKFCVTGPLAGNCRQTRRHDDNPQARST